jgi:hypothetical protein
MTSSRAWAAVELGASRSDATSAVSPSTHVNANTDSQLNPSSSSPEASSPSSALPPATPAQMATARSRSRAGNTFVTIASVEGMIAEAPRPMTARTAISPSGVLTNRAAAAAEEKTASPVSSTGRRPMRSPIAPDRSSRPANTTA